MSIVSVFVVILVGLAALFAARSVVAEADAHRQGLPDRWLAPVCPECGSPLNASLLYCVTTHHRQRVANIWILASTVVVFVALAVAVPDWWLLPAYLWFGVFSILLTVTDLDTKLIPNRILGPATVGGLMLLTVGSLLARDASALLWALGGGVGYFLVMFALALLARGALGFGDVKLAFFLGVFTGYLGWGHVVLAAVWAVLLGGLISLILLVTRIKGRKDAIPFGPFMTSAGILAVVFGDAFVSWYTR
jgi:prepilin signal peptidase PulO-like enzyme (type II secretory pathway)